MKVVSQTALKCCPWCFFHLPLPSNWCYHSIHFTACKGDKGRPDSKSKYINMSYRRIMWKGKMMGKPRKLVCRNSPAGITLWSLPSSTPSKRKHLSYHTNRNISDLDFWMYTLHCLSLCNTTFLSKKETTKKCESCTGSVFGHMNHKGPLKIG